VLKSENGVIADLGGRQGGGIHLAGFFLQKKTAPDGARVCAVMEDSRRSDNGYGPMRHKRTIIHSAAEDKLASNFFINVGAAEMYSDAGHGSKIFNRLLFTSAG
jgi:hypothetical protein